MWDQRHSGSISIRQGSKEGEQMCSKGSEPGFDDWNGYELGLVARAALSAELQDTYHEDQLH